MARHHEHHDRPRVAPQPTSSSEPSSGTAPTAAALPGTRAPVHTTARSFIAWPAAFALLVAMALLLPTVALAQHRVFINDVDVTGHVLRNQTFSRVDEVRFDDEGNVRIIAPSYSIQLQPQQPAGQPGRSATPPATTPPATTPPATTPPATTPPATTPPATTPPPATRAPAPAQPGAAADQAQQGERYIVTYVNPNPGAVPYVVVLLVNGREVARFAPTRGNAAQDITDELSPGTNEVALVAQRDPSLPAGRDGERIRAFVGPGTYENFRAQMRSVLAGIEVAGDEQRPQVQSVARFTFER